MSPVRVKRMLRTSTRYWSLSSGVAFDRRGRRIDLSYLGIARNAVLLAV